MRVVRAGIVVVPMEPGPLIRVDGPSGRSRDELDEVIDELLPDTDDGPGWFDLALVVIGAGLIGWGAVAGGPTVLLVVGAIALGLGCILPARSLWRRVARRRRARTLASGVPMRVSGPAMERLVRAYDELVGVAAGTGLPAVATAHGALMEVASLLRGRVPELPAEREYVETRAVAIEQLTEALREHPDPEPEVDPAALLLAREELDAISGFNSLTRLEELAAELRTRRADG